MTVYLYVTQTADPLNFYVVKTTNDKFEALVSFVCDETNVENPAFQPTTISLRNAQGLLYSANVWSADVIRKFNSSLIDDTLAIDVEPTRYALRLGMFIRVRSKWEHIKLDTSAQGTSYSDAWANYNRSFIRPVD